MSARAASIWKALTDDEFIRWWWLGVFFGDGNVKWKSPSQVTIHFGLCGELKDQMLRYVGAWGVAPHSRSPDFYQVFCNSLQIGTWLRDAYGIDGPKSSLLKVPEEIRHASNPRFWHFLRGYFDTDGSASATYSKAGYFAPQVSFSSNSVQLLEDVCALLEERLVFGRIDRSAKCHKLVIRRMNSICRLYDLLYSFDGPHLTRKREKMSEIVKYALARSNYRQP